jgi:hypothetical protein
VHRQRNEWRNGLLDGRSCGINSKTFRGVLAIQEWFTFTYATNRAATRIPDDDPTCRRKILLIDGNPVAAKQIPTALSVVCLTSDRFANSLRVSSGWAKRNSPGITGPFTV